MTHQLTGELTCSIGVTDLGRSIDWYQAILGFKLLYRVDEIGWCEMETSVVGVNVGLSENETVPQGGGATTVWSVARIEDAKAHLDQHAVKQDGDIRVIDGLVKLITFFDPDGNAHMFSESLEAA